MEATGRSQQVRNGDEEAAREFMLTASYSHENPLGRRLAANEEAVE
jgi:hypothetical protein